MTLGDLLDLSESRARRITRALQLGLVGLLVYGVATVRPEMAVSGGATLGVTLLPALLRREYGYSMDPGLVLWLTVAMTLHVVGALGLYEQYQWYDEVTHVVSGTLIAGIGYAAFRALELHSDELVVPAAFRGVFIVVFVLAAGIFWEVLEFGLGGLVTVYGIDDIVTVFIANAAGAVLVAVWGTGYVDGLIGFFSDRLRAH